MDLKITSESLAAAKKIFNDEWFCRKKTATAVFEAALDALCVPVESEGWIEGSRPNSPLWLRYFDKGNYRLIRWEDDWMLYLWDRNMDNSLRHLGTQKAVPFHHDTAQAQTWADAEIAKYEGVRIPKPKPPGPGTRLILPDGTEVVIIKDCQDDDVLAINPASNQIVRHLSGKLWHESPQTLIAALGAKVKE